MSKNIKNKKRKMQMKNKSSILLILTIGIFIIGIIGIGSASLGTFKSGECVQLVTNLNTSAVNISGITTPTPNPTIDITNVEMSKSGNFFNYTFCNTSKLGTYTYGYCDFEGNCYNNDFKITPSGKESSVGESILYLVFVIVMFGLFVLLLYFIFSLPKENEDNKIVKIKYLRIFFIALTYPIIMIILNLMNGLAINFTSLSIFSGTLGFLFEIMLRGAWVWTILMFGWVVVSLIKDTNFKKHLQNIGRFKT